MTANETPTEPFQALSAQTAEQHEQPIANSGVYSSNFNIGGKQSVRQVQKVNNSRKRTSIRIALGGLAALLVIGGTVTGITIMTSPGGQSAVSGENSLPPLSSELPDGAYIYMASDNSSGLALMRWTTKNGQGNGSMLVATQNTYYFFPSDDPAAQTVYPIQVYGAAANLRVVLNVPGRASLSEPATLKGDTLTLTMPSANTGMADITLHSGTLNEWQQMLNAYRNSIRLKCTIAQTNC